MFSTYFHHLICVTYKDAVHMRCHHKKNAIIHLVHPSKELCIPYILARSYVLQGRTLIISPVLHTRMQFTWDVIMKISVIYFQIYFMHTWFSKYQTINNIDTQIKIWIHNSALYRKSDFCNHEAILILFGFCKWEYLSLTYACCPKTWTFAYNMSSWHHLDQPNN